jgi:hypothetical protein
MRGWDALVWMVAIAVIWGFMGYRLGQATTVARFNTVTKNLVCVDAPPVPDLFIIIPGEGDDRKEL